MCVEITSRGLAALIVVTCLFTSVCDTYVLPGDDFIPRSLTNSRHHNHQHQQEGRGKVMNGGVRTGGGQQLDVRVEPEYTVMYRTRRVTANCTATASKERPYVSFFWQILDDTSLPLSSSVPGVAVVPLFTDNHDNPASSNSHQHYLSSEDNKVHGAKLVLGWRFYNFLPLGDNKFGCLAYTENGRRSGVQFFTIHKI